MNPGQVGFYRVCYTKEMVEKIIPAIKDMSLPPLDRLGIENDQFALVSLSTNSKLSFAETVLLFTL